MCIRDSPYAVQKLELGQEYYFQGIVTGGMLRRQMVNPQVRTAEQIQAAPFEAVDPQTEGLSSSAISRCIRPVSYTHLDVYKRQRSQPREGSMT